MISGNSTQENIEDPSEMIAVTIIWKIFFKMPVQRERIEMILKKIVTFAHRSAQIFLTIIADGRPEPIRFPVDDVISIGNPNNQINKSSHVSINRMKLQLTEIRNIFGRQIFFFKNRSEFPRANRKNRIIKSGLDQAILFGNFGQFFSVDQRKLKKLLQFLRDNRREFRIKMEALHLLIDQRRKNSRVCKIKIFQKCMKEIPRFHTFRKRKNR